MNLLAKITPDALGDSYKNFSGATFLGALLANLIAAGFVVGSVMFLFMLLYGGIQYITSGGDKAQVEAARGRLTNALVGLVILFGFYAIVAVVGCFFNLNFLQFQVGPFEIGFGDSPICGGGAAASCGVYGPCPSGYSCVSGQCCQGGICIQ